MRVLLNDSVVYLICRCVTSQFIHCLKHQIALNGISSFHKINLIDEMSPYVFLYLLAMKINI